MEDLTKNWNNLTLSEKEEYGLRNTLLQPNSLHHNSSLWKLWSERSSNSGDLRMVSKFEMWETILCFLSLTIVQTLKGSSRYEN